jgi:hypothetical protein
MQAVAFFFMPSDLAFSDDDITFVEENRKKLAVRYGTT